MVFRYYSNTIAQASRAVARGFLLVGLLLVGFGVLILALPDVFAFLAAGVFFFVGIGAVITAVKITWGRRPPSGSRSEEPFRENVRVHRAGRIDDLL